MKIQNRRTTSHTARAHERLRLTVETINADKIPPDSAEHFAEILACLPEGCRRPPMLGASGLIEAMIHHSAALAGVTPDPPLPAKRAIPHPRNGGIFTF